MKIEKEDLHFLNGIKPNLINKFIDEINEKIKSGKIKTEADAKKIAKKYLKPDEPSYQEGLAVCRLLSHEISKTYSSKKYVHPFFKGKVTNIVYKDIWGRIWSKTTGILKSDIKTSFIKTHYVINKLGGMSWRSKDNKNFVCEYRTTIDESKNITNPETFIG